MWEETRLDILSAEAVGTKYDEAAKTIWRNREVQRTEPKALVQGDTCPNAHRLGISKPVSARSQGWEELSSREEGDLLWSKGYQLPAGADHRPHELQRHREGCQHMDRERASAKGNSEYSDKVLHRKRRLYWGDGRA